MWYISSTEGAVYIVDVTRNNGQMLQQLMFLDLGLSLI